MILKGSMRSEVLGMETGVVFIFPQTVTSAEPLNVCYTFHGLTGNCDSWLNNTMLPYHARLGNTLFVLPEVHRSFYTDMRHGYKFFEYVTEELPKIVKGRFNVSDKREFTGVLGASMGGYGALKCALTYPERYGFCYAFSSACLYFGEAVDNYKEDRQPFIDAFGEQICNDMECILGMEHDFDRSTDLLELAKAASAKKERTKFYSACGFDDYLYNDNVRFANDVKPYLDYHYEEWEGEHNWEFFNAALIRGFAYNAI